ncbi:MAG: hypothetical protein IRY83_01430 [Chloroflexi bacterium]|nr:hypothetical protein [Chloroflexota bacterium]
MAQMAPTPFRLTKHQTAEALALLEERKWGHRLTSQELAQRADVELDVVNSIERHLPLTDPHPIERVAHALGITPELLRKIAALDDITPDEWATFAECARTSPPGEPVPSRCEHLGFRRIWR